MQRMSRIQKQDDVEQNGKEQNAMELQKTKQHVPPQHCKSRCSVSVGNPSYNETLFRVKCEKQIKCRDLRLQSELEQKLNDPSPTNLASIQPVGYCFDVAIGLADILEITGTCLEERSQQARTKLVELALAQSSNKDFRDLLAPEIRHAAALTAEVMNYGIQGLEANILPHKMCTEEMKVLVNCFFNVPNDEMVKDAVAACNNALGRSQGMRLHLDDLRIFFQNADNRNFYSDSYKQLNEVYKNIVEPVNVAFDEYCSRETTYRQYIQDYYGQGGWFAFQREFTTERSTSMVDVTAKLLQLSVTIYDSENEIYYRTECYGSRKISIKYNGVDHFTVLTECTDIPSTSA